MGLLEQSLLQLLTSQATHIRDVGVLDGCQPCAHYEVALRCGFVIQCLQPRYSRTREHNA